MPLPLQTLCVLQLLSTFCLAVTSTLPHLGAVASESDVCSEIGANILQIRGNAADAIVATIFCVGVTAPYNSGLGGGGFATIRKPDGSYEVVDFREKAPMAVSADMFAGRSNMSIWGGLASAVPGQVRGLQYIHETYGKLPWEVVVLPSVKVASEGWIVNEDFVYNRAWGLNFAETPNFLSEVPTWAVDFAPNGTLLGVGERITRRRLADTLNTIAREGPDAFYTGPLAKAMIAALQADNGIMNMDDLANYSVVIQPPISITYRNYTIYSCSAPCSGPVVLSILKTLEGYDNLFAEDPIAGLSYQRIVEAVKFAYGRRTRLADPAFVSGVSDFVKSMLSPKVALETRQKISDSKTNKPSYYNPEHLAIHSDHGTSHMVAADKSGLAISATTTINLAFGSHLMIPETGVIMNNNMDGFSIPGVRNAFGYVSSSDNYPGPGKRPLSSMSPAIAETQNGSSYFVIGAAGGSRIITANVQNLINIIDRDMTGPQALANPRLHHQLDPNYIEFEWPFDNQTVDHLRSLDHDLIWTEPGWTTAQAVRRLSDGRFEAASEPRQSSSKGVVALERKDSGSGWFTNWTRSICKQELFGTASFNSEL